MSELQPYLDQYGAAKAALPGAAAPWLAGLRDEGIARFRALGFPTPKVEAWKYTNLNALRKIDFRPAAEAEGQSQAQSQAQTGIAVDRGAAHRLTFVNGGFRPDLSDAGALPEGVELTGLAELLARDPAALEDRLGRLATDDGGAMVALNTALMADGYVLRIGRDVTVADPIEILFVGTAGQAPLAYHPRNLVIAEPGAEAVIVEDHIGYGAGAYFANGATEIFAEEGARLRHYKLQDEAPEAYHLHAAYVRLAAGAAYESFQLAIGGRLARHELCVTLDGAGASCRLNGAYLADGERHVDNTTLIDHASAGASSREVYKGVLDGKARAVFQGTIRVRRDAQQSDGHQLHRALLLSEQAEIDAKPALEIYADDVKCSHGATVGELDDDALFYLRARGIPADEARRLLIRAFLDEVVDEITFSAVRDAFRDRVSGWLAARG